MDAIEREMSAACTLVLKQHMLSMNPLLDDPAAIQPHMHCLNGG